jgi:hypothetical protein
MEHARSVALLNIHIPLYHFADVLCQKFSQLRPDAAMKDANCHLG